MQFLKELRDEISQMRIMNRRSAETGDIKPERLSSVDEKITALDVQTEEASLVAGISLKF